jgi:hypothetical protein
VVCSFYFLREKREVCSNGSREILFYSISDEALEVLLESSTIMSSCGP